MNEERYPDNSMPFAPEIPKAWQQFADLREDVLLDYGRNTARAYWSDLQDTFEWAVNHDKDILQLTTKDLKQYVALHRRRKYAETTIRRRITALRLLYAQAITAGIRTNNPAADIIIRKRTQPAIVKARKERAYQRHHAWSHGYCPRPS